MWKRGSSHMNISYTVAPSCRIVVSSTCSSLVSRTPIPLSVCYTTVYPSHAAAFHSIAGTTNTARTCASRCTNVISKRHFHTSSHRFSSHQQDHYKILGLSNNTKATKEEIKKQYYKLAKQYHPDTTTSTNAKASTEQFTKIQNAYEVLGDEKLRREYDRDSSPSSAYGGSYGSSSYGGSSSSAYSSSSSSSHSSGFGGFSGFSGFRPDEQEYSFRSWSTRGPGSAGTKRAAAAGGGAGGTTANSANTVWEQWEDLMDEDVDEDDLDDDEDMFDDESELFSDLFGEGTTAGGGYARAAAGKRKRTTTASAASAKAGPKAKKTSSSASSKKAAGASTTAGAEVSEGSFFSGRNRKTRRAAAKQKPKKGEDVLLDVHLSFMEAALGVSKHIDFVADGVCKPCRGGGVSRSPTGPPMCKSCGGRGVQNLRMPGHIQMHVTCERCDGSGFHEPNCAACNGSGLIKEKRAVRVNIPAGVETTTSIRVMNQGHAGRRGGAQGHLLLKAIVAPHAVWTRSGADLSLDCPLPLTTAILGGTASVPTLDGGVQQVRVAQGTQHLSVHTIPGKGIKVLSNKTTVDTDASTTTAAAASTTPSTKHGSQHITWKIEIPSKLTPKAKDLLKQLALEMGNIHNIDLTADIQMHAGKGKLVLEEEKVEEVAAVEATYDSIEVEAQEDESFTSTQQQRPSTATAASHSAMSSPTNGTPRSSFFATSTSPSNGTHASTSASAKPASSSPTSAAASSSTSVADVPGVHDDIDMTAWKRRLRKVSDSMSTPDLRDIDAPTPKKRGRPAKAKAGMRANM